MESIICLNLSEQTVVNRFDLLWILEVYGEEHCASDIIKEMYSTKSCVNMASLIEKFFDIRSVDETCKFSVSVT